MNGSAFLETLPVQEIFSSFQGEGPYVGKRQVFVRVAHCHLKCQYCDTPMTTESGHCYVEMTPGSNLKEPFQNPLSIETILNTLTTLSISVPHHSVSFTGGEPLLYHRSLASLFPQVQALGLFTYLETSGTQPEFLKPVLPFTDIMAMDIKLASATGEPIRLEAHQEFYTLCQSAPDMDFFIKLVFSNETTEDEIEAINQIVTHKATPIILQPVSSLTQYGKVDVSVSKMFWMFDRLSQIFSEVRLIPQTHKMLQVL